MKSSCIALSVALLFTYGHVNAAGYNIKEQGVAAAGRNNAVVAKITDPTAIYFNPAGMGFQKGLGIVVNGVFIFPSFKYSDPEGKRKSASLTNTVIIFPSVFAGYNFGAKDRFSIGVGIYAPFGMRLNYQDPWAGEQIIQSIDLQTIFFTPSFAWRINKYVAVGAGINLILARIEMTRKLGLVDPNGDFAGAVGLSARKFGVSFNLGIQVRPYKGLHFGLTYRAQTLLRFKGKADFEAPQPFKSGLPDQTVRTNMFLPDQIDVGIGYQVNDKLYLELDFEYTFWQIVNNVVLRFDAPLYGRIDREVIPQNWRGSWAIRFGVQYKVMSYLTLRLGAGYDRTPVPDSTLSPFLPDSDRIPFSAGLGYVHKGTGIHVNLSYLGTIFRSRTVSAATSHSNFPQRYNNSVHILGLSLGIRRL